MLKTALFLLALVAAVCHADEHHRCIAPKELTYRCYQREWEGGYRALFFVEYDSHNEQVVMYGDEHHGHQRRVQELLFLHREHTGYNINWEQKTCKKFEIGKFHPFKISPNSTYEGTFGIGPPANTLDIDRWVKRHEKGHVLVQQDVSKRRCYPVSLFVFDEKNSNKSLVTDVYDLTLGIQDPNAFNVPDFCDKAVLGPITKIANYALSMFTHSLHN